MEMIKWKFIETKEELNNNNGDTKSMRVREIQAKLMENINPNDMRPILTLALGDPSIFPCFRACRSVKNAVVDSLSSDNFNSYATTFGLLPARKAVAEYLSKDLPYTLSANGVFLTIGCSQAIDVALSTLARPGANILLPTPGYPYYKSRAVYIGLETRHYNLLPENEWEVDLHSLESQADSNTVAMVIINPGNPCGNVFTYNHLQKVAEVARKLGIMVISDEVYGHLTFGSNPFVPMGVFASIVPVITVGSLSKRWIVPGWRLGWLVINDIQGILLKHGVVDRIHRIMNMSPDPVTFIQAALPQILKRTNDSFFSNIIDILQRDAHICYEHLKDIPALTCPYKAEGSMFMMVKLNMSLLEGVQDDVDFCIKLAKEENMIILPGVTVGLPNWLRVTFALEPSALEEGLERLKSFCRRHAKSP